MKLPSHDPLRQTMPDAMHTIKDATEHVFKLIIGKEDSKKVQAAELAMTQRFGITSSSLNLDNKKSKGAKKAPDVPYVLSPEQIKLANQRSLAIRSPVHIDFVPGGIFHKTSGLKSHDWKQVLLSIHFQVVPRSICIIYASTANYVFLE